ncbi:SRPBCC family protein [Bradyrhizobium zhanjiangense]|uniref:SRPBCC family protein n=1 Tax=Bradyrhizobium zhanjiangense TaxID=1325107 RepID=UPI001FE1E5C8|nr:SRPBCC family protein [Bradyrhizobium zhanjiangense]
MTQAYYSAVLDHPMDEVWSLIRDFNNYPAYIDGVSESVIEDDKCGDEVGAIRRFCYLGNWIRQRLVDHSDRQHTLTYAGLEALPYPQDDGSQAGRQAPAPTRYQGTMHLRPIIEGDRTLIEMVGRPRYGTCGRRSLASAVWLLDSRLDGLTCADIGSRQSAIALASTHCSSASPFGRAPPIIRRPSGVR